MIPRASAQPGLADSYTVKKFDPAAIAAAQAADDAAEAAGKSASVEDFTRAATQLFDASAVEEAAAEKDRAENRQKAPPQGRKARERAGAAQHQEPQP